MTRDQGIPIDSEGSALHSDVSGGDSEADADPAPNDRMLSLPLKPCPFCDGAAEFERHGTSRQSSIVVCEDCGARVEANESDRFNGFAWNRRDGVKEDSK